MTLVDRHTRCILGWAVAPSRTEAILPARVDAAPQARFYYRDWLEVYRQLLYTPGIYTRCPMKAKPTALRGIMLNYAMIWLVWDASGAVSPAVFTRFVGRFAYLSIGGIRDHCIAKPIRPTRLISFSSYQHLFRPSRHDENAHRPTILDIFNTLVSYTTFAPLFNTGLHSIARLLQWWCHRAIKIVEVVFKVQRGQAFRKAKPQTGA